jgi:transcriptional repressor NrdR
MVQKRDGTKEPFSRTKLEAGVDKAIKNRPVTRIQVTQLLDRVESRLRRKGPVVTSQQVGVEVLSQLARLDQVAYLRFASVYKDFQDIADFEREVGRLLEKREPAKRRR